MTIKQRLLITLAKGRRSMSNPGAASTDTRQTLTFILNKYGRRVIEEPWRVQGLLNDCCPTRKREITALVAAQKERAVADLAALSEHDSVTLAIARWARQLYDRVGLAESLAYWAVETWALALGVLSEPTGVMPVPQDSPLAETVISTISTATDTTTPLDAAAKSAEHAMKSGQLGAAADCLRSILEAQPGNAQAQIRLDRILAKRREYLRQAENHWVANQWTQAVAVLEKANSRFPDDEEIAERLAHWRRGVARVLGALNHEIPELKAQKRFHALVKLLEELESLKVPLQGLKQNLSTLRIRIAAIEPVLREAQAEFNRQQYQLALLRCEQVLAAVVDHPAARQLRQQIFAILEANQKQAKAIHHAIEAGLWAEATQLLNMLPISVLQCAPFDAYQRQVGQMTRQILGYWRLLGAAGIGALLWILSGWLARLVNEGLKSEFPQFSVSVLRASTFSTQMLFASLLLGAGGALVAGRRGLESIYRNCVVTAAATGIALMAMIVLDQDQNPLLTKWTRFIIEALAAGLLIGIWLWFLPSFERINLLWFALATAGMAAVIGLFWEALIAWSRSPTAVAHMLTIAVSAVNLVAALTVFGLVDRWWKFGLMPIGVLLACGLAIYLGTIEASPLLVMVLGGLILAGAVLPLIEHAMTRPAMVGVMVIGLTTTLATHTALKIETVPNIMVLMTIWSAAMSVQALRSADRPTPKHFVAGLQFVAQPTSTAADDSNRTTPS